MLALGYIKDRVAATTTNIQLLKNMNFTFPLCSKIQTQSLRYLNETSGTISRKQLAIKIPERPRIIKFQFYFNTMFLKHALSDISIIKHINKSWTVPNPQINTNLIPVDFEQTWVESGELASDEGTEGFNLSMLRLRTGTLGVGTGELMELAEAERGQRWDSIKVRNLTRQNKNQVHSIGIGEKREKERKKDCVC